MNITRLLAIIVTIVAMFLPETIRAQEFGDVGMGRDFAVRFCASCHTVDERNTPSPEPAASPFKAVADRPSTTRMALTAWLQSSHPTMPNLILDSEEKSNVIAYILHLKDSP